MSDPLDDTTTNVNLNDDVSLDDLDENEHDDDIIQTPAINDQNSASGHSPDLETDDDVDDMGEEAGVNYNEDEELGINNKVPVVTETEPPSEDTPY